MNSRLYEADFDYPIAPAFTKEIDWVKLIDLRIATRIVWLCQWSGFCRSCDCKKIIQSCWTKVSEDGYIEISTLFELRKSLEEKFSS